MNHLDQDIALLRKLASFELGMPTRVIHPVAEGGRGLAEWHDSVQDVAVLYALEALGKEAAIPTHATMRLWSEPRHMWIDLISPRIERELTGVTIPNDDGQLQYRWDIRRAAVLPGVQMSRVTAPRQDGWSADDAGKHRAIGLLLAEWYGLTTMNGVDRTAPKSMTIGLTIDGGWLHTDVGAAKTGKTRGGWNGRGDPT